MSAARTGLEVKLKIRTEENGPKDHLLAALERTLALEPPPEARESPETPSERVPGTQAHPEPQTANERVPWWRRMSGGWSGRLTWHRR
jgi:hypothetical protein